MASTIVLTVPDESLVAQLKKACLMLKGVTSVKIHKESDKPFDITETAGYREAMEDIKAGRVHHADSAEDMFKKILG